VTHNKKTEETTMSTGFQQQSNDHNHNFYRSAPTPQHGSKPDQAALKRAEPRTFAPKPAKPEA
jgi:hypothetical protein